MGQVHYGFWLALRPGASEWDARILVAPATLKTLEHGKTYTRAELGIGQA